jgi:DNA-3-methyladenine glycosylase II
MDTFTIAPQGPFSLEEAARFGFGQRHDDEYDGTMRLAFCVDGYRRQAGVSLTQDADGVVHGVIAGFFAAPQPTAAERAAIIAQAARVLSLDHDATSYQALGQGDPVIARLLEAAPGLRPPLFYSPYEAALWAVISMRRPRQTAERWRTRLSGVAGAGFDVAGRPMWAVPTPERLVELGTAAVATASGMEPARAERVVAVAQAALAGALDADLLRGAPEDDARAALRAIPGIGPFYADLILIRATGVTDVMSLHEPRLLAVMGELYETGAAVTPKEAERLAEGWRPWRTWVAVLFRAAGHRVLSSI